MFFYPFFLDTYPHHHYTFTSWERTSSLFFFLPLCPLLQHFPPVHKTKTYLYFCTKNFVEDTVYNNNYYTHYPFDTYLGRGPQQNVSGITLE